MHVKNLQCVATNLKYSPLQNKTLKIENIPNVIIFEIFENSDDTQLLNTDQKQILSFIT